MVVKKNYIKNVKILDIKNFEIKTMTEVLTYYTFLYLRFWSINCKISKIV